MKSTETKQQTPLTKKAMNKANYGNQLTEALQNALSVDDIVNCLQRMFDAVIVTKGGNTRPDYRTQERALTLLLNYTVGTPVQRQEQVHYNMDMSDLNEDELITKLA
jgi:hypothetical protein